METAVTMEDHSDIEMLKKMDDLEQTLCPDKKLPKTVASQPRCSPLVRRNLREKRGGTAEKKHGLGEKRCGQKQRRRGQEEKTGGVTVKRTWSGGKRRWNKKHYCVFCRRPQVKIARHLLRKHADEQEVMAASALPTGSKERHLLLEHLRCRGNYLHNIEVIRQGSGEIIPWRQPSEEVDARNYLPCPLCLGFFLRADLWKHQVSCRKKLAIDPSRGHASVAEIPSKSPASMTDIPSDLVTSDSTGKFSCDPEENTPEDPFGQTSNKNSKPGTKQTLTSDPGVDHNQNLDSVLNQPRKRTRVQAAASRLLPISSGASESCSEILHRMNLDNVSYEVKSDWLICKYGNKLMGNQDGGQRRYDYFSQKLRELGRLLLAAKSLDSGIRTLQDLLTPGHLSLVLSAARKAAGYRWSCPPLSVKTTLKTVCDIAIGESLQDGDWEAAAKTTEFYHILGKEWDNLGLQNSDPDPAAPDEGTKPKKQVVQSTNQKGVRADVPVTPRKIHRRPWSSAEKEAIWRQLGEHVLVQSVPGKEVCQQCLDLEPVLRGRHWKDIKNQVHNQIQSQKKQQFHAQMELEEDQQHQTQNQSQKKQQALLYDPHMDQQRKEPSQNQKKRANQSQMDLHSQDNSQNQKQRDQLDHRDHLLIHKRQLCHTSLDHQDHSQVYKKQLYQMDQQNQSLQPVDRDTSILTVSTYGPDGPLRAPGHSLRDREATIVPYPVLHRSPGPHMDPLLTRTDWTNETLHQNYPDSRLLVQNLLQEVPTGDPPPNPHSGHIHFG